MIPPATIPLIAPYLFERFQNNAKSITGPNVAPKPAQANDTIWNTELLGLLASWTGVRLTESLCALKLK